MKDQQAMPAANKAEVRDALQVSHEYAKHGMRFFPMLIASDEELEQIALQNMQRLANAVKSEDV
tara:strand:- start:184 stop:375 length:192 start_codon:yes stop_codon:yes gene_type:complete